ncbi:MULTISPECIES: DnaB-like helicase N-terminal domain-containing protein [unclassified Streptomyces]|uniref:DnaB-like helicase N-terminal domain-containing protein n=1 Tax=unclassified Streptomyces TaxID=2593676 RepID=UPI000DAC614E|nr:MULTISPECIES: DnaB-like helicase N-terminal domain-containing protein [unclassified Streptomyces]PZT76818.1 helicase DnaB [Streptomyces sp. AC1-42W]PZT79229.1 helicase DnaB [Streptomyces sp. AC1-42T]
MTPLQRAEQAVLGAVLLDPGQLSLLGWLVPEHFDRPVHRALFTALRKLQSGGHGALDAEGTVPLSWVTDAVDEASRHVRGLTAVYAHMLISACPRPEHAPVYARMVLEGAIHRTIAQHAVRLRQAARADALQGQVDGALHRTDVLAGVLDDLAQRWGTEPRPVPATEPPATDRGGPVPNSVMEDEQFLLAVLADRPKAMDAVVGWLRPGDFADPGHGQLYRCLGALHHRGEPVDRLTLLWEAQRRGFLADGTLTTEDLAAICDDVGAGDAAWLGEQVLRSSVTRTAAASADEVLALAGTEALSPGRLINHALHALGPLDEVRARWQTATGRSPAPPPQPTPSSSGPPAERMHAALARSTPSPVPPSAGRTGPAPAPASTRPPARGHH